MRSSSELVEIAQKNDLMPTQTENDPIKFVDSNGVVRITIKQGSSRTPGSNFPHVEFRDSAGQRVDRYGNPVTRKSVTNHTPINYDL